MKKEKTEKERQDGCQEDMLIITENQEILSKTARHINAQYDIKIYNIT